VCGYCGFQEAASPGTSPSAPSPSTTPDVSPALPKSLVIGFEPNRDWVTNNVAQAYFQTASAGGDMRESMPVLEQARATFVTERDALQIWKLLNEAIGQANPAALRPALVALRTRWESELCNQQEQRLRNVFDTNVAKGWREWLRAFAEALAYWRMPLCQHLLNASFPFPDEFNKPHDFKRSLMLILHERWTEVYQFFSYLAELEFLHPVVRARFLITKGQIQLYYFPERERALKVFEEAESLAPDSARVLAALGDYYVQQDDTVNARAYLERAMTAAPGDVESYVYLGDLSDRQGNIDEAATCYQNAISKAGGDSLGYTRLLRLYGRPELIEKYESYIVPLAERAMALDETGEYRTYLDVGDAYMASRRFDDAQKSYRQAIALDPSRLDGYMWQGFAYLEEGASQFENAEQAFTKAREVASEAYNGYWGAGQLCERREQWAEAADWYAKVSERQPELQTSMLARIAQMRRELKEYDLAEAALIEAFKTDGSTEATLFDLADEYYKTEGKAEDATKLFKRIKDAIGSDSFEASYRNRQGNADFNEQQWEKAAENYLAATRLDDTQAVYYSNLAGAYGLLHRWADARAQMEKVLQLTGDQNEYQKNVALSHNDEGNSHFALGQYEEAAKSYTEAARLVPTSPRYPSNRSLALERIAQQLAQSLEAGEREANAGENLRTILGLATADARSALEGARTREEWSNEVGTLEETLNRIERKAQVSARYGLAALTVTPRDNPIRVQVATDIAPLILNPEGTDLSAGFLEKLGSLRERIQHDCGLLIAPPFFAPLEVLNPTANFQIQLLDEPPSFDQLDPSASDPQGELIAKLEATVRSRLHELCSHQDAANALAECDAPECSEVSQDPYKLHLFTLRLKEILSKGESIADCARICRELTSSLSSPDPESLTAHSEPPANKLDPGILSLNLHISKEWPVNRANVSALLDSLPMIGFTTFGVLIPLGVAIESDELKGNSFRIQSGDIELAPASGLDESEVWLAIPIENLIMSYPDARAMDTAGQPGTALKKSDQLQHQIETEGYIALSQLDHLGFCIGLEIRERIDLFLTEELVEHYLSILGQDLPALITVTRHFFSTARLTEYLRDILRTKASIRDLAQVLERLLEERTSESRTA
jgi:tetratricopeptide (TPR) repeat protein